MSLLKRWVLAFVAPKPLVGALHLPRYMRDLLRFRAMAPRVARPAFADTYPCLTDWTPSTPFDPHYFYQGAWLTAEPDLAENFIQSRLEAAAEPAGKGSPR